jgi:ligand-binding sensor domain-containing protein
MICKRITLYFCIFIAFILRGPFATAQTPQRIANLHLHLDYKINHILPDPKGFLWLATESGLVRYDGSTVETYTHDPANPQSLPMNHLTYLLRDDKTGLIWIASANAGLVCFDPKAPKNKAFTTYRSLPNDPKTVGGNALNVLEIDKNRHLWIGGDDAKLTDLDLETLKFTRHTEGVEATIFGLCNGGEGKLFIGTLTKALMLYDTRLHKPIKQWDFKDLLPKNFDKVNSLNMVGDILLDKNKTSLWCLFGPAGLVHLDLKTDKSQTYNLGFSTFNVAKENNVLSLNEDHEGKFWLGHTLEGMIVFNPKTNQVERRLSDESEVAKSKSPLRVNKVYTDKSTNITWIGTTKGLFSYSPVKNTYTQLTTFPISNKMIQIKENLLDKSRAVWILTDKNLLKMDGQTRREVARFTFSSEMEVNQWSSLDIEPSGVYVRTVYRVSRVDEAAKKIVTLPIKYDITGLADDTLSNGEPIRWISTYNAGLFRLRNNGTIEHFPQLPTKVLLFVHRTSAGSVWIGTDGIGLLRLKNKEKVSFDHFSNDPKVPNSLPDNIPTYLHTDSQNRLWLATASNGLSWIENAEVAQPIFHQYSINKVENPFISSIYEDGDGNIWADNLKGKPYVFNPKTHESHLLMGDGSDILPNRLPEKIIVGQGKGGVWLANTEGVTFIDKTNESVFPKRVLPIHFTGLTIFNTDETERLANDSTVQLSYRENFFSLKFSALNFEGNTQYRYKLEGIDDDWVNIGSRNMAYYTNIPHGKYTFRVRASVGIESEDDKETRLEIVILPPFWQTWWFRFLALISVGGALYWLFLNRLRQIKYEATLKQKEAEIKQKEAETSQLRAEFQQKIAETELSALRAQMNPHFIFNCLNSLNLYILENHVDLASDYLQRFSKLIRLVLENSRLERIPLINEVEALKLYMMMEGMRFKEKLTFDIQIDPEIDAEMVTIPPLLLQPFIENAIWHGLMHKVEGGTIWLKITQPSDTVIHAEIVDNGIGRAAAAVIKSKSATQQKSFGMKVTGERIAAINQIYNTQTKVEVIDLKDENGNANGTKIIVEIPV